LVTNPIGFVDPDSESGSRKAEFDTEKKKKQKFLSLKSNMFSHKGPPCLNLANPLRRLKKKYVETFLIKNLIPKMLKPSIPTLGTTNLLGRNYLTGKYPLMFNSVSLDNYRICFRRLKKLIPLVFMLGLVFKFIYFNNTTATNSRGQRSGSQQLKTDNSTEVWTNQLHLH
jgi:hypothetical protein